MSVETSRLDTTVSSTSIPDLPSWAEPDAAKSAAELADFFENWSRLLLSSLRETDSTVSLEQAQSVLDNMLVIWFAGGHYKLLKPGTNTFAELLKGYELAANSNGWFKPPNLGEVLVDMLKDYRPHALESVSWQPSSEHGLLNFRLLNSLSDWEITPAKLFAAFADTAEATPAPIPTQEQAGYHQLSFWDTPPVAETPAPLEKAGDIILVTSAVTADALLEEFKNLVAHYCQFNAEARKATAGYNMLDLFDQAETTPARPVEVADIPRAVLAHFKAAPDLAPNLRRAAMLALYAAAFEAYTNKISFFKTLPDWEL